MTARFLQLADVAEELSVTVSQVYHMVRSGELPAIKVGGRGQWRGGGGGRGQGLPPEEAQKRRPRGAAPLLGVHSDREVEGADRVRVRPDEGRPDDLYLLSSRGGQAALEGADRS